jgi:hypothetical protein
MRPILGRVAEDSRVTFRGALSGGSIPPLFYYAAALETASDFPVSASPSRSASICRIS